MLTLFQVYSKEWYGWVIWQLCFIFLRNLYTDFCSGYANLHFHQPCGRVSVPPHHHQHVQFFCIPNDSLSDWARWNLSVVLIFLHSCLMRLSAMHSLPWGDPRDPEVWLFPWNSSVLSRGSWLCLTSYIWWVLQWISSPQLVCHATEVIFRAKPKLLAAYSNRVFPGASTASVLCITGAASPLWAYLVFPKSGPHRRSQGG